MYRLLRTRRWVILSIVALILIPTCMRLSLWQWHRHEGKVAASNLIKDNERAEPVAPQALMRVGGTVPSSDTWRRIAATGHWDTADQQFVKQRTNSGGDVGFMVLTPLVLSDGRAVLVNRGWVAQPQDTRSATLPTPPPTPSGTVHVVGRLRPSETRHNSGIRTHAGLPAHELLQINSSGPVASRVSHPLLGGYLELISATPYGTHQPELTGPPSTDTSGIPGLNVVYTVQWLIFAALVPVGWWVLLRREHRDQLAKQALSREEAAPQPEPDGEASVPDEAPSDSVTDTPDHAIPAGMHVPGPDEPWWAGLYNR